MISPGCFVTSISVYEPPEITSHKRQKRPNSAMLSYISRNRHIRNPRERPMSSSTQRSSVSEREISIERRMIWNDMIIGMIKEENGKVATVRVYMKNDELVQDPILERWPISYLKIISRAEFVTKIKIPTLEMKWIPKEASETFLMSNLEKNRLELSAKRYLSSRPNSALRHSSMNEEVQKRPSSTLGIRSEAGRSSVNSSNSLKRPSTAISFASNSTNKILSHRSLSSLSRESPIDIRTDLRIPGSTLRSTSVTPSQFSNYTTSSDVEYLEYLIDQRKKSMKDGKIGTYFMNSEQVEDQRIKMLNRRHSTSKLLEEVSTPFLTQMFDVIRKDEEYQDESSSTSGDDMSFSNIKLGASRMDRILLNKRESCFTQLQNDIESRKEIIKKQMENDGIIVFGKDTNYEHFFKARIQSIDYLESQEQITFILNTKGLHHECILDAILVPVEFKDEAIQMIWQQISENRKLFRSSKDDLHDIIYFPVKYNASGQLSVDVFIDLQWIQCMLLNSGLAIIDENNNQKLGIERMYNHQNQAKGNRLGIWKKMIIKRQSENLLIGNHSNAFRQNTYWEHSKENIFDTNTDLSSSIKYIKQKSLDRNLNSNPFKSKKIKNSYRSHEKKIGKIQIIDSWKDIQRNEGYNSNQLKQNEEIISKTISTPISQPIKIKNSKSMNTIRSASYYSNVQFRDDI